MESRKAQTLAGKVVEGVYGGGYISPAASIVFQTSLHVFLQTPEADGDETASKLVDMFRPVGLEAKEVGFE